MLVTSSVNDKMWTVPRYFWPEFSILIDHLLTLKMLPDETQVFLIKKENADSDKIGNHVTNHMTTLQIIRSHRQSNLHIYRYPITNTHLSLWISVSILQCYLLIEHSVMIFPTYSTYAYPVYVTRWCVTCYQTFCIRYYKYENMSENISK